MKNLTEIKNKLIKLLLNNQIIGVILLLITLLIILFSQQQIVAKVHKNDDQIKKSLYQVNKQHFTGEDTVQIEVSNDFVEAKTVQEIDQEVKRQEQIKQNEQKSNTESEVIAPETNYEIWELTAYTSGYESTGKTISNPTYKITASGEEVKANYTIACPRTLPFGAKIYIPYFDNTFVCTDRGGAIKGKRLDVYMETLDKALEFGRRKLEIKIIK